MEIKHLPIHIKAEAKSPTHLRADTGQHVIEFDKAPQNGGTDLGPSPIHAFVATLNGCTYVLLGIVAKEMGVTIDDVHINTTTDFNPSRLMNLSDDKPIESIHLQVSLKTDATAEQMLLLEGEVSKRCPIATIIRDAGIEIVESWRTDELEDIKTEI